jgi:hypothetical protein
MHKLTRVPPIRSKSTIAARIEHGFADSGEMLRKGMEKIRRLSPPLLDSFLQKVLGVEAELQNVPVRLRVSSSDGGEFRPELGFQASGKSLGKKRKWCLGFQLGGGECFYGLQGRRHAS